MDTNLGPLSDSLGRFRSEVLVDEGLQEALRHARTVEDVIGIAAKRGYDLRKDVLEVAINQLTTRRVDFTDTELEEVVGLRTNDCFHTRCPYGTLI